MEEEHGVAIKNNGNKSAFNSYLEYMGAFKSKRIIRESLTDSPMLNYFTYIPAGNKVTISSEYRKSVM